MSELQSDTDPAQAIDLYEELLTVFSTDENEFKSMDQLLELHAELEEVRKLKADLVQKDIEAICQRCDGEAKQLQQQKDALDEPDEVSSKLKEISAKKDEINIQIAVVQSEVTAVDQQKEKLEKEKQQMNHKIQKELPSHKHDCNLYSNISGIRWQYDVEPHEVKGYISSKNRVKTFSLNCQQNSQQFITNYLWDQLETDW